MDSKSFDSSSENKKPKEQNNQVNKEQEIENENKQSLRHHSSARKSVKNNKAKNLCDDYYMISAKEYKEQGKIQGYIFTIESEWFYQSKENRLGFISQKKLVFQPTESTKYQEELCQLLINNLLIRRFNCLQSYCFFANKLFIFFNFSF